MDALSISAETRDSEVTSFGNSMPSPCEITGEYMPSIDYDWKTNMSKRGWPYKGDAPDDPQYIRDQKRLFNENGNGWWIKRILQ